jgi:tetratricopeptide (TPR) repeat protein
VLVLGAALASGSARAQTRPTRGPSARAARLIQSGDAFLAAGDRGSAIAYYRDAVEADPRAVEGYERLGDAYHARGSYDDARAAYETALSRHPEHASLWLGLARTLVDSDRPDDAAAAVRSLLLHHPDDPDGLAMRAELAFRRGAWSEALTAYRTLLAASERLSLDPARVEEARRYESALRVLARPIDPVSAPRACDASPLRRALARCP